NRLDRRGREVLDRAHPRRHRRWRARGRAHLARQAHLRHRLSDPRVAQTRGEEVLIVRRSLIPRLVTALGFAVVFLAPARASTEVERVISPLGIEAWLVRSPTAPLIAIDFSFRGGSSQDPADKAGVASMVAGLIDEGAGDLDARTFHEQLETNAIALSF